MRSRLYILLLAMILLLALTPGLSAKNLYMQVKVSYDTPSQLKQLQTLDLDIIQYEENMIEIITSPDELEKLQSLGFKTEIVHEDLVGFYQSRLDPNKDMGGYMTLDEINTYIDTIIAAHPEIVSAKISIGQTIEGRDMWAFKISDNPDVDEDEPEILYAAAIHAREVITPLVLVNYINHLVANYPSDPDIQELVDSREMWFVMPVNPDGYYHNEVIEPDGGGLWRKNRRDNGNGTFGVDLNRNFGYMWGYNSAGSSGNTAAETYRGTAPFSEPESQNMRDFHIAHEFQIAIYFHSYGNILYTAWNYNSTFPPDYDIFQYLADSVHALNGYTAAVAASGINGSTDDWVYGEQTVKNKTFAFTHEVGFSEDGFWPRPERIPQLVAENLQPCLFMAEMAGKLDSLYLLRPPVPPVLAAPDTSYGTDFTIEWTHDDPYNPAVEFDLVEMTDYSRYADPCENFDNWFNSGLEISTDRYHSGSSSFYCHPLVFGMRYIIMDYEHEVEEADTLSFWTYYDLNPGYDYAFVGAISNDSIYILEGDITTSTNPNGYNPGHGLTGSSGGWVQAKFDLSAFASRTISVALVLQCNNLNVVEGIYYDDIYPVDSFSTIEHYSIDGSENSYDLTGKLEKPYYYRLSAKDAEDQWSNLSNIQKTVVDLGPQYICGDAQGDESINVSDAVYIINYVFVGGAAPDPLEAADANCDSSINVSDAVWIINYVFVGGNLPCDLDNDSQPDC